MIGIITHTVTVNGMEAIHDFSANSPNRMMNFTVNGTIVICLDLSGTAQIIMAN